MRNMPMWKRITKRLVRQCLDPFIRLALSLGDFQRLLLDPAGLRVGEQVLDVGCGTGALAVLIRRRHPLTNVWGFERDADALDIAKVKAARLKAAAGRFSRANAAFTNWPQDATQCRSSKRWEDSPTRAACCRNSSGTPTICRREI